MLNLRLTNCAECADITSLIQEIDCKVSEVSVALYNNLVFMLNKNIEPDIINDLMIYRRILTYKVCNPNYAGHYTVNMIASRIKILKFK
jgi:hypothetical protein